MDYVVGSVAALISGNVTPNRPKKLKKADTPMKHQPSPNVTPKSEFVEDRSIFLSPSMQKKKAIVKKSPKRIFQNPDLDVTKEDDGNQSLTSPKADKVKKHLKEELEANCTVDQVMLSPKSPESEQENLQSPSSKKKMKMDKSESNVNTNEITPKKKKKQRNSVVESQCLLPIDENVIKNNDKENVGNTEVTQNESPAKKKKKSNSVTEEELEKVPEANNTQDEKQKSKKKKKNKLPLDTPVAEETNPVESQSPKKKNKKNKNKKSNDTNVESNNTNLNEVSDKDTNAEDIQDEPESEGVTNALESQSPKKNKKNKKKKSNDANIESENVNINSNAVTNKDSDSEHESDNEIESENEEINKKALETAPAEDSSEDEAEKPVKPKQVESKKEVITEEEIKRTIFVGNVPFSSKCKKEIKKIFSQYGQIETVRIRTVPVKDARVTPKMAVIKNELHPDRSTVNVYVKYADTASVDKALAANNTVLNDHHLRVSRSDTTGAAHDPKCAVFVGNIPFALEDETLRAKFEKCGEIESVRIIRDKKTNAGKGFGYINFSSKDGVELALALTDEDLTIKNRIMRVKRCTQAEQRKSAKPDRRIQGQAPGNQFGRGRFPDKQGDEKNGGAYRRVMNKRRHQDGNDGPPNKRQNLNQPHKEKKTRKEFVGITAEKKKKQKFNKGLKKKKALSEILTKK
ncbi:RNA-binding protein 34 [Vanessa cardui]|uniref:RNA-binding protein 34 n=1 Tax=Vanessa cardui TaxID=171605 RepID=UPI001F135686|nr:RNA-binding protein 34 [Vanessa cardui]